MPPSIDLTKSLAEYLDSAVAKIEQAYIHKALEKANGHVGRCALLCGLSRRTLTAKMAQYRLNKAAFKLNGNLVSARAVDSHGQALRTEVRPNNLVRGGVIIVVWYPDGTIIVVVIIWQR